MISNLATVAGLVMIVALCVRAFRSGGSTPVAVGLAVLAIIAIMTVTNKTLSPQYLLWFGGPAAALLLLARSAAAERAARRSDGSPCSFWSWPCSPTWSIPCSTTGSWAGTAG